MGVAPLRNITLKDMQESLAIAEQDLKDYQEEKSRRYREYTRAQDDCRRQEYKVKALKEAVESFRKANIE